MVRIFTLIVCALSLFAAVNCAIDDTVADLTAQLSYLTRQLQGCYSTEVFEMRLHRLVDSNATCNDGTSAGYYLRRAHGSKRWIVYLEGGWFCNSARSCDERKHSMGELMSSQNWRETKRGSGLLSTHMDENPSWWNANHVYIPYCSSDVWSGNASKWESGERFSFMGVKILDEVIENLLPKGLYHAKHLLLAGSSAGGIGVILNLDRVAARLKNAGSKVQVRGIADSGWYLDEAPPSHICPGGRGNCGPAQAIKQGMTYWQGVVPERCVRSLKNPQDKWKCYFGEHVYSTLKSPLFVFQWVYDQAQLAWVASRSPLPSPTPTQKQINYFLSLGTKTKNSFTNKKVCAIFAPSCLSHTILTRSDWLKVKVDDHTLNDALDAWYQSSDPSAAGCSTRQFVDSCFYPQCNPTCPEFQNQPAAPRKTSRSPGVPIKPGGYKAPRPLS